MGIQDKVETWWRYVIDEGQLDLCYTEIHDGEVQGLYCVEWPNQSVGEWMMQAHVSLLFIVAIIYIVFSWVNRKKP